MFLHFPQQMARASDRIVVSMEQFRARVECYNIPFPRVTSYHLHSLNPTRGRGLNMTLKQFVDLAITSELTGIKFYLVDFHSQKNPSHASKPPRNGQSKALLLTSLRVDPTCSLAFFTTGESASQSSTGCFKSSVNYEQIWWKIQRTGIDQVGAFHFKPTSISVYSNMQK
jgi:hypothetical protein